MCEHLYITRITIKADLNILVLLWDKFKISSRNFQNFNFCLTKPILRIYAVCAWLTR